MTTTVAPIRWSSTADCPRKAVYGATVEPDRDWTDREARILFRGRSIGADYATWLEAHHGEDAVLREVKVEWAFGVGHMDIFLVPTETAIEVLSSKHATDAMIQRKLLQLVGYMEAYPAAKNGCLIVLDPGDFSEDRWPLAKDTDTYRELLFALETRLFQLVRWRDMGVLPDRVCRKPSEAIGHFCRHAETCFQGWEPPAPASVVDDPKAIKLAGDLAHMKIHEAAQRAILAGTEADRKEIEAELAALDGVAGIQGDITIGPFTVKRVFVQRKPSLNTTKALAAGAFSAADWALLAPYMKPGAAYWTTTVARGGDGVAADFGDEAPF